MRRLTDLALGALRPPPGRRRILIAYAYGAACHALFGIAVLAMIAAMFFGMSESFGRVPAPWSILANAALILQFPLAHSVLLSKRGGAWLARLAPPPHGG
ncbi:MAG: isoprenylcysteine carboxylmethyltransferase family protein, partial [Pseudomonadota bacterium]